jgi:exopolyphosphatase / guanosine-5'-triphosphate,3'-diphosphate pyrophosphatase
MTRVAAVDLGTNSTRLLVADVDGGDRLEEVARLLTITRLGEGVDERRRLLPVPIARVRNTLTEYRRELEKHGATKTLAIGTSAVRDSENGEAFLGEIEWSYGFSTRLLDGGEEAALMLRGVAAGRSLEEGTLLVDIGGGSTELVLTGQGGTPAASTSIDVGCVRVTERFLASDPPSADELAEASSFVRSLLPAYDVRSAIGVAGTVTTLATLDLEDEEYDPKRTHGHRILRASLDEQLERLAAMTTAERERAPGLEPGRAPVIVAGLVVLREILDAYDLDEIEASERDILHGAALAAAELPETVEGDAPPGAYTCC